MNELVKHVLHCTQCEFQKIKKDYNSEIESNYIQQARQHAKETGHSLMVQS